MKKVISVIPFMMLFISAISGYCSGHKWYNESYEYLANIFGFSIITNLVFAYLYFRKSFCLEVQITVLALFIMNVLSIIFLASGITYNYVYDTYITVLVLFVFFVLFIKKIYDRRINSNT